MDFEKTTRRIDIKIVASFWIVMILTVFITVLPLSQKYETQLLPVVGEFTVRSIRQDGDWAVLSGDMKKLRDCEFLSLTFYAGDPDDLERPRERLDIVFLDQPEGVDRSRLPGRQPWGPWRIARPHNSVYPRVFMRATHACHTLWHSSGIYLDLPVETLFGRDRVSSPHSPASMTGNDVTPEEARR